MSKLEKNKAYYKTLKFMLDMRNKGTELLLGKESFSDKKWGFLFEKSYAYYPHKKIQEDTFILMQDTNCLMPYDYDFFQLKPDVSEEDFYI
jgi:hypothetical protein